MISRKKAKTLSVCLIGWLMLFCMLVTPVSAQQSTLLSWEAYMGAIWAEKTAAWSWATPPAGTPIWDGTTSTAPATTVEGAKTVYLITTPQELWWTRVNFAAKSNYSGAEIRLMNDIDMGGADGKLWTPYSVNFRGEFNGQGHAIYNLRVMRPNNENNGLFSITDTTSNIHDLRFVSPKIYGKKYTATVVGFDQGKISDVTVENAWVELPSGGEWGSVVVGYCNTYNNYDRIVAADSILFGGSHLGAAVCMPHSISNSYAIGCTVISMGYHSGGFMSCTDYLVKIKNCFSNCEVYGTKETGAFLGYATNNGSFGTPIIENCFGMGSVEGMENIGGFSPVLQGIGSGITVRNCYSTALVGLANGGTSIGSFVGSASGNVTFQNCYAAGEVGGLENNTNLGGFIGVNNGATFQNCYYDKQTTAMREVAGGSGDTTGIVGLLTNSEKGGGGYQMTGRALPGLDPGLWKFEDQLYPQLRIFSDAGNAVFADTTMSYLHNRAAGAAYSAASVATSLLAPWEMVPMDTAYDTVRDITRDFPLSQNPNHVITWSNEGNHGDVEPSKPILTMRDGYMEHVNTVGIEWIYAAHTATVSGASVTAIRPLRLIPTRSLYAGADQARYTGESYDNWADLEVIDASALELSRFMDGIGNIEIHTGINARSRVENGNAPAYAKNSPWITDQNQVVYDYFASEDVRQVFNGAREIPDPYGGKRFDIAYTWLLADGRFLSDDKELTVLMSDKPGPPPVEPSEPPEPSWVPVLPPVATEEPLPIETHTVPIERTEPPEPTATPTLPPAPMPSPKPTKVPSLPSVPDTGEAFDGMPYAGWILAVAALGICLAVWAKRKS